MTKNIFIELELFLDPPIDEAGAMREHLEKVKIPDWNKRVNNDSRNKFFVAKAKSYIADGLPRLKQQAKSAREEKYKELTQRAKLINEIGVTEKSVQNLKSDFKKFFREDTIEKLVPLESSSQNQSGDEFIVPVCPASLKCDKPVSLADMRSISFDLNVATDGKCDSLYKLLEAHGNEKTADILTKAMAMEKKIHTMPKTDIKADSLYRLSIKFMLFFKNDNRRKKYDVALKRFCFDEYASTTLKHYVENWITKNKTDWKQYHACIDEVKKLGYSQEETSWLVYEYFCITKECPLPKKSKQGGWRQFEPLRSQLLGLFNESIETHRSNMKIKDKLQSVIEQFNDIDDPDNVKSTVSQIIEMDLRNFWDSCKKEGIVIPLFKPAQLANYSRLKDYLLEFTQTTEGKQDKRGA